MEQRGMLAQAPLDQRAYNIEVIGLIENERCAMVKNQAGNQNTRTCAPDSAGGPERDRALAELEAEENSILRELEALRTSLLDLPEMSPEAGDPAFGERDKTLALIKERENHLAEITRALNAARAGQYGICERCGRPIESERLEILPETRLCIQCKGELEKLAHRRGR